MFAVQLHLTCNPIFFYPLKILELGTKLSVKHDISILNNYQLLQVGYAP
jgi:hypothetical protein